MKIYSIISRIEDELEDSPKTKFAGQGNRRVVEIDRLFDLLDDLKVTIPEDIRRATGILAAAENTIQDAKEKADDIIAESQQEADQILQQAQNNAESIYRRAQEEYEQRVSESEIYKEALNRANEISQEAETNANAIYNGAKNYAEGILLDLQNYLSEYHRMIADNRAELSDTPDVRQPDLETAPERSFNETYVHAKKAEEYRPAPAPQESVPTQDTVLFDRNEYQEYMAEQPAPAPRQESVFAPKNERRRAREVPAQDEEEFSFDDEEEEVKPKKKNFFQRMFEVEEYEDDDDEEDEDDFEDEPPKRSRLKLGQKSRK
ncbi:MAG: hypothetical protein IJK14_08315 [Clostridia bacterium]|nr:hypothetical protein [Clostridia bacterium]MBR0445354.1 hypothetical protein [Clostridia bacterium]